MEESKTAVRLLFATIALAAFVDGLDGTIVTTVLPEIAEDLGIGAADSSWVITIYFLMMAGLILIFGKISDRGALKAVIVGGFAVFGIGSLLCAFSDSFWTMLAFRALQGVGGGMLSASGIMIAVKHLPKGLTALGLSISVLGYSVGGALGPVLGGVLTESLDWGWIFLFNVPIGVAGAFLAAKAVPKDGEFDRSGFDWTGSAFLFVAMVTGLYVIESIPAHGFGPVSAGILLLCAAMLILFVIRERRASDPVLRFSAFRRSPTVAAIAVFLLINLCWMGVFYLLPFYMQIVLGYDAVTTGLVLCVQSVVTLVMCVPVGRMVPKRGSRHYVILGAVSTVVMTGVLLLASDYSPIPMMVSVVFLGVIWGFGGGSFGTRIVDSVSQEERGDVSPMVSFVIYFGSALGSALYSGLFSIGSGVPGALISELSPMDFMDGFLFTMAVGTVLAAVSAVLAWAFNEEKDRLRGQNYLYTSNPVERAWIVHYAAPS
jgi:EmrB/QacA subfamily drug resistance transporter